MSTRRRTRSQSVEQDQEDIVEVAVETSTRSRRGAAAESAVQSSGNELDDLLAAAIILTPEEVEASKSSFETIPDGEYVGKIVGLELKKTKKEPHRDMICYAIEITDGEYKNRKVWKNVLLQDKDMNPNPAAFAAEVLFACELLEEEFNSGITMDVYTEMMEDIVAETLPVVVTTNTSASGYTNTKLELY